MNKKFLIGIVAAVVVVLAGAVCTVIYTKNKAKADTPPETTIELETTVDEVDETDTANLSTEAEPETKAPIKEFKWNGKKEIWVILPTEEDQELMSYVNSIKTVIEKAEFKYVVKTTGNDSAKQLKAVEDAISSGNAGAVVIVPVDVNELKNVADKARESGIIFTVLGADVSGYEVGGCLNTPYETVGMFAVQTAEDWINVRATGENKVPAGENGRYEVAIDYYDGSAEGKLISKAMKETIETTDSLTLVSETQSYGETIKTTAKDSAAAILKEHPNCRVFVAQIPESATGIAEAISEYAEKNKLDVADFCVISCSDADDTFREMWNAVQINNSANAIKGYVTCKSKPEQLAVMILGMCGVEGHSWKYGDNYYNPVSCVNVYGFTKEWKMDTK